MSEMLDKVADALERSFKERVAASADKPFDQTGVQVPGRDVWVAYARAAVETIETEDIVPLVMWAEVAQTDQGTLVWQCNEYSNRDGMHEEYTVELNPETFAVGTKLRIYEPGRES